MLSLSELLNYYYNNYYYYYFTFILVSIVIIITINTIKTMSNFSNVIVSHQPNFSKCGKRTLDRTLHVHVLLWYISEFTTDFIEDVELLASFCPKSFSWSCDSFNNSYFSHSRRLRGCESISSQGGRASERNWCFDSFTIRDLHNIGAAFYSQLRSPAQISVTISSVNNVKECRSFYGAREFFS